MRRTLVNHKLTSVYRFLQYFKLQINFFLVTPGRSAFLYFLYFPIFSHLRNVETHVATFVECNNAHTWFSHIDVTEQAALLTTSDHGMLFLRVTCIRRMLFNELDFGNYSQVAVSYVEMLLVCCVVLVSCC